MAVSGYFIRRTVAQNESGVASSVAGLASLSLADGQVVATTGYYSGGDGGANTYIYHGTGRPTADGGFYINGPGPDDYFEAINKTEINVRQFGARGDGSDDQSYIQSAINTAIQEKQCSVYFPAGTYDLNTPVNINFDTPQPVRLFGSGNATPTSNAAGGTIITGGNGIESCFILMKTDLTTFGTFGFECEHISFEGSGQGVSGPLSAIKNKIGGAPARPFVVKNCNFRAFDKAIFSDITESGLTTGICQVSITECNLYSNNYALYATGPAAIMDLLFYGNVSEQGGKIGGDSGSYQGGVKITDNLLEGQSDAIHINGGLAHVEITRNYFETNSGYLYKGTFGNGNSTLYGHDNYILSSTGATVEATNCYVDIQDELSRVGCYFRGQTVSGASKLKNRGLFTGRTGTQSSVMTWDSTSIDLANGSFDDLTNVERISGTDLFQLHTVISRRKASTTNYRTFKQPVLTLT